MALHPDGGPEYPGSFYYLTPNGHFNGRVSTGAVPKYIPPKRPRGHLLRNSHASPANPSLCYPLDLYGDAICVTTQLIHIER